MTAVVVVGAQWGDEGKGKIVDYLASLADAVVRYAGGPNAGHTLVVDGQKIVVRLVPSGILHPDKACLLGQGMVVEPTLLVKEIDELHARGHQTAQRLFISDRAHVILPHHVLADGLRENAAKADRAIGTTRRGIGPTYEDKAARRGLLLGHLRDLARARDIISDCYESWRPFFAHHGTELPSIDGVMADLELVAPRIVPLLVDGSAWLHERLRAGARILLEGAQGTLLDIDHGTYPFVTSSSAIAGGACTGLGIGPRAISRVLGITKAYTTRVGAGPFPTELSSPEGEHLKTIGGEFGSVTGRPRRTGWLDLPALRYAARVNGFDGLVITKLDVLRGLNPLRICVAYDTPRGRIEDLPSDLTELGSTLQPVYKEFRGWSHSIEKATAVQDLPSAARAYLAFIEESLEIPCDIVSVGPSREATMIKRRPFA